jgi:hypothetical protein
MKSTLVQSATRLDAYLLARPKRTQYLFIVLTLMAMVYQCLPDVPRQYADYSRAPILNDLRDMYSKRKLDQTPEEASRWSKEASSPYPPAVLLADAGLYALGQWTGIGFYGVVILLACLFLGLSIQYFLATRWYLFPVLYLNFSYFGYRFVFVQDSSYLVMLVVIMAALLLARAGRQACHALMAVAIDMKLAPLYYAKNILWMARSTAVVFVAILLIGLVLPYVVWDNYLDIYRFQEGAKGDAYGLLAGVSYGILMGLLLWYVEMRLGFDMEDRIGWGLVPFAMFLAMKMNVPRHLLIVLLVPDKRGLRNIAAAIGLGLPSLLPQFIRFGSSLSITTGLLFMVIAWYLKTIGWGVVWEDLRQPGRTLNMMLNDSPNPDADDHRQ